MWEYWKSLFVANIKILTILFGLMRAWVNVVPSKGLKWLIMCLVVVSKPEVFELPPLALMWYQMLIYNISKWGFYIDNYVIWDLKEESAIMCDKDVKWEQLCFEANNCEPGSKGVAFVGFDTSHPFCRFLNSWSPNLGNRDGVLYLSLLY